MSAKNGDRRTKKNFWTPFIYNSFSHRGPLSNFLVQNRKKKNSTQIHSMFILVRLHRFICTTHSVSQKKKQLKTTTNCEKWEKKWEWEWKKEIYSKWTKRKTMGVKTCTCRHIWSIMVEFFRVAVDSIELKCTYLSAWTVRYTKRLMCYNPLPCEHFSLVVCVVNRTYTNSLSLALVCCIFHRTHFFFFFFTQFFFHFSLNSYIDRISFESIEYGSLNVLFTTTK